MAIHPDIPGGVRQQNTKPAPVKRAKPKPAKANAQKPPKPRVASPRGKR